MREYLAVFLVAVTTTYLLAVLARETALRLNAVAQVRDRDVHAVPVPYLGGVAMYGGLVAAYFAAQNLPFLSTAGKQSFDDARAVILAGGILCALGVVNDIIELDALTKLAGQILAAVVLFIQGVRFYYIWIPGHQVITIDSSLSALFTVVLVVATVNAVNFIDGLDGLAAGVIGIGATAFFLYSYHLADINKVTLATTAAVLCAALAGSCAGFLPHNFNPAQIFMGDSGSMLIGFVLAGSALTITGFFPPLDFAEGGTGGAGWLPVLLPILLPVSVLIVPFTDLVLAVVRRTMRGQSPFAPDKKHLHHRLLQFGHSQRRAAVVMWCWAALIAFGGVALSLDPGRLTLLAVGFWLCVCVAATAIVPGLPRPEWTHHEDYVPPGP